jgi:hypothetical protein
VVGFTNGFRAALVMASFAALVHGKRLAQARGVRIRMADPVRPDAEPGQVFMQVDGEPWQQKVPSSKERAVVVSGGQTLRLLQQVVTQQCCWHM